MRLMGIHEATIVQFVEEGKIGEVFLNAKSMVSWSELMRRICELDVELIHINSEISEIERQIQLREKE